MVNRRQFLSECSALVAAAVVLPGCSAFWQRTQSFSVLVQDPAPQRLSPSFQALIATIIPLHDPIFQQASPAAIEHYIDQEFSLYSDSELRFYRRGLALFQTLALFPLCPTPLRKLEEASPEEQRQAIERDEVAFQTWQTTYKPVVDEFASLGPSQREAYLMLWSQSRLSYKRAFYRASRTLIYAGVFSQKVFTKPLGYLGPLREEN